MKKLLLLTALSLIQLSNPNTLNANVWHEILGISEYTSMQEINDKYQELKQDLEDKIANLKDKIHLITYDLEDIKAEINKLENIDNIEALNVAKKNKQMEFTSNMHGLNFLEQQLDTIFDAYKELTKNDHEEIFEIE